MSPFISTATCWGNTDSSNLVVIGIGMVDFEKPEQERTSPVSHSHPPSRAWPQYSRECQEMLVAGPPLSGCGWTGQPEWSGIRRESWGETLWTGWMDTDQVGGKEDDKVGCDLFPLVDQLYKESKVSQYRCTHHIPHKMISTVSPYVTMRSQCRRWCCGEGKPRCGQSQEQVQY